MAVKLSGHVYDEKGVGKNGVTVEAVNIATSAIVATDTTDVNGLWAFDSSVVGHQADLADATYEVKAKDGSQVRIHRGDAQVQYKNINLASTISPQGLNLPNGTAFPASPAEGRAFYRTDEDKFYVYDGAIWQEYIKKADAIAFAVAL